MPEQDSTLEIIRHIIHDYLYVDLATITPEARLIEDLGADSLDTVEITMTVEGEFGFEISDEEGEKLKTVADIVKYIDERKSKK